MTIQRRRLTWVGAAVVIGFGSWAIGWSAGDDAKLEDAMKLGNVQLVMLGVSDLNRSTSFYRDQLGLEVQSTVEELVFLKAGSIMLGLSKNLAKVANPVAGAVEIVFGVENVHAAHKAMKAKGVNFVGDPKQATNQDWVANFRDPDGHLLSIFGRPGSP